MSKRSSYYIGSSVHSKESSISDDATPREKVKDCCRKFVAFMCTQVGVGGLVVCYALIGAIGFSRLESGAVSQFFDDVERSRYDFANELWDVAQSTNVFNRSVFEREIDVKLQLYQDNFTHYVKKGYNGGDRIEIWSFSGALMFSLSIITMIGYGNLVPKTAWGKITTVVYAIFGIPLYVLYFMNMGEILAGCFRWFYTKLYACSTQDEKHSRRVIVPSTACLWVIGAYILTGTIMFAQWEHWSYLDSTYFCVTSLCKLGFGDLVPGVSTKGGNEPKLVINFIYILVGLGLVAMCFNLMREDIRMKIKELREDFRQCLEDTRVRFLMCCRQHNIRHKDI